MITIGIAQREGTSGPIADATATYTSDAIGHTAVAVVDGIGHDPDIVRLAPMLAETAVRVGAAKGGLAGILTAGQLVADPGPDAVGVIAVTRDDGGAWVCWAGDCRAYHWDDYQLHQPTTDHNMAAYLTRSAARNGGHGDVPVAALADYVSITLGLATRASIGYVPAPPGARPPECCGCPTRLRPAHGTEACGRRTGRVEAASGRAVHRPRRVLPGLPHHLPSQQPVMTGQFEDELWVSLTDRAGEDNPDAGCEPGGGEEFADPRPLRRRAYEMWWGRPWSVYRSTDRDPDIPETADIDTYHPT